MGIGQQIAEEGTVATTIAYATVHEACAAFAAGQIDEETLFRSLVSLPIVKQAKRPDEKWFDAIVVNRGPVYQLRREAYRGTITPAIYSRSVQAMLDAGHAA
jgi:hypothetical protein